jgi:hypothetical protein
VVNGDRIAAPQIDPKSSGVNGFKTAFARSAILPPVA